MSIDIVNERTISIGHLRQNPTEMIRAVRAGDEYILTDRGLPAARIVPFRPLRWVPADDVRDILNQPGDPAWVAAIETARDDNSPTDPWEP